MSNIISIVLILASIGLFFGYVDPTYAVIREQNMEKTDYDRALNNSKQLQAERDKLLEKYNEMSEVDRGDLTKLLPDNIDNVRLILDIDEMAKKYGMRIRNFKTEATEKNDTIGSSNSPHGTLTLSFSTTAPYNTFLAFMRDLEESLRLIDIASVEFASSDIGDLYDYKMTVKTYWLK
ncbi:MAG: type 4a pilus biogenesis protein PilO [bacterium]|nr:type 4a pilus biogenesis protein PilO [bacterium]